MALVDLDPRVVERLTKDTPARSFVCTTLKAASEDRAHASRQLRLAARDARKLRSRERRALFDVVYDLLRQEAALSALGAGTWADRLDLWLTDPDLSGLDFAVRAGCPDWAADDLLSVYGEAREDWLVASNGRAPSVIRVNPRKTSRDALQRALAADGIVSRPVEELGLEIEGRANLVGHRTFRAGHFELQDTASQRVAAFVEPDGATVLDLCAGAGGKSLALAAFGAKVVATDIRPAPLAELRKRARRGGVRVQVVERHARPQVDKVLVDAPCSGSGVWRRHPEFRWRLADEGTPATLQVELLSEATGLVRPGGEVVYATCSALRRENEGIVEAFLAEHPDWERARADLRTSPHVDGSDGMYAAAVRRRLDA